MIAPSSPFQIAAAKMYDTFALEQSSGRSLVEFRMTYEGETIVVSHNAETGAFENMGTEMQVAKRQAIARKPSR